MRTLTHKRVLSAVLATGLAASAMVALAATSDAATAKLKADATTSAGATLTITGTDLLDDNGVPQYSLTGIRFSTAACAATISSLTVASASTAAVTASGGTTATTATANSDTKITLNTSFFAPTLVAGKAKYNVCVYDSSLALFGSTSTTFYTPPATINAVTVGGVSGNVATLGGIATSNVFVGTTGVTAAGANLTGPTLGGTKVSVKGLDFTSKTYVTVGGVKLNAAKTTLAKVSTDADVITGTIPPGTGSKPIKIVGEFGTYPVGVTGITPAGGASGSGLVWAYSPAITVSPSGSDGAVGRIITVTGTGLKDFTFTLGTSVVASKSHVLLVPAGTVIADTTDWSSTVPAGVKVCQVLTVDSDSSLTCKIPALTSAYGAYNVAIITTDSGTLIDGAHSTGYSRASSYTAAAF